MSKGSERGDWAGKIAWPAIDPGGFCLRKGKNGP